MRLVMYLDGHARPGAMNGDSVIDLLALSEAHGGGSLPSTLRELIERGENGLNYLRGLLGLDEVRREDSVVRLPVSSVTLLPPLDPPAGNVLAIGRNYGEHAREQAVKRGEEIERPTVFTKAQTAITGPFDDIAVDEAVTQQVDWEAELGVVIGRAGKNVAQENALNYVFGYTVVNDLSARDVQYGWGGQYFKGKSLDGFCPIGPCIVTADEIPDPQNLRVTLRVNGTTKQDGHTGDMIFPVAQLISELSLGMTLPPAALIATGTPSGVGYARTPQEFLHPGDVIETEIEGIGMLRNRIVKG